MPRVQVLMPVFNAESFLRETMVSLINQSFSEFQILALDDGSTDKTLDILQEFAQQDSRILVHENEGNQGIIESRNRLFELASSPYLALADADDVYHPERLKIQLKIFETYPEVVAVSGAYRLSGTEEVRTPPTAPEEIRAYLTLDNVFANPCAMLRRSVLQDFKLTFDAEYRGASDYHFWLELSRLGDLRNVTDELYRYRLHPMQESKVNLLRQRSNHLAVISNFLQRFGIEINKELIAPIIWPTEHLEGLQAPERLWKVVTATHDTIVAINRADIKDKNEIARIWDLRLRSLCRRFGKRGLFTYAKVRGVKQLVKGKYFGMAFMRSCLLK